MLVCSGLVFLGVFAPYYLAFESHTRQACIFEFFCGVLSCIARGLTVGISPPPPSSTV